MGIQIVFYVLTLIILLWLFLKNLSVLFSRFKDQSTYKNRLEQLKNTNKNDLALHEIIEMTSKPFHEFVLSRFKPDSLEILRKKLKFAKWDKTFKTPEQYIVIDSILKIVGVIAFLILYKSSIVFALLWALPLFFLPKFLLNNTVSQKKDKILCDFPDLLRIIEGYVIADIPFSKAVEKSMPYVCEEWQDALKQFVIASKVKNLSDALESLKDIDLFEVKEFVSLTRLVLDQGGDTKKSFSEQADKIKRMHKVIIDIKISKRQTMATLIQMPILMGCFIIIGIPVFNAVTSLSTL